MAARGLTKTYAASGRRPAVEALKSVDLEIPVGSFFGLLGPNGAGKSTFINVLSGLARKTAGAVEIWGYDIDTAQRMARSSIGVVPQELNLDPFFTPFEAVELQAGLHGVPRRERRTAEILKAVRLSDQAHAYARALSGGMRRRLLVAKAMAHSPPILVLDEPTAGVDVELRRQLWDTVRALNRDGVTVVLTTHYLEEAEELCDRIAILDKGRVIACEPTRQLVRRLDRKDVHLTVASLPPEVPESLRRFEVELRPPDALVLRFSPSRMTMVEVLDAVRAANLSILDLSTEETDLEEVFLSLTSAP
ncbi:MAG: ABC transporter ATP-binding protein [Proteobacteria bacterium]|nr:ABC transporter ATP-binding protein [Pseudomonadota bacterium]